MSHQSLPAEIRVAFAGESATAPTVTLRGGNAIDEYNLAPPFDPEIDAITDEYLETYPWGVSYLDADSWRHYLPSLIEYAFQHMQEGNLVIEALLSSLRPPDREPPRLTSLSVEQEALVTQFLDALAFSKESANQELACQVLEEWWAPGALYRTMPR